MTINPRTMHGCATTISDNTFAPSRAAHGTSRPARARVLHAPLFLRCLSFARVGRTRIRFARAYPGLRMWSMGPALSIVGWFIADGSWSRTDTSPIRITREQASYLVLPCCAPARLSFYLDRKDYAFRDSTVFRITANCTRPGSPGPSMENSLLLPLYRDYLCNTVFGLSRKCRLGFFGARDLLRFLILTRERRRIVDTVRPLVFRLVWGSDYGSDL